MVGNQQRQRVDNRTQQKLPEIKQEMNDRFNEFVLPCICLPNIRLQGPWVWIASGPREIKDQPFHDGRKSTFPPELLCVPKQIHCPCAPEFFAVRQTREDPWRARHLQSVSPTKAMLDSLTGAYTAVDLIAFAQGYAMSSLNLQTSVMMWLL
jgi:hypothetical protein